MRGTEYQLKQTLSNPVKFFGAIFKRVLYSIEIEITACDVKSFLIQTEDDIVNSSMFGVILEI